MKIISALSTLFAASVLTGSALACGGGEGKAHFDTNQDGKVSLTEALDGAKRKFEARDQDKNGSIDQKEMEGRGQRRLAQQDANKDGKLTLAEAQAGVRQWFTTLDKNKDGMLSEEERPFRGRHGKRGGAKAGPRGGGAAS